LKKTYSKLSNRRATEWSDNLDSSTCLKIVNGAIREASSVKR